VEGASGRAHDMSSVGACPFFGEMPDPVRRGLWILEHIRSRDADDLDTLRPEVGVTTNVSLWPIARAVRCAVHLDAEARVGAVEVEDEWADRMLATEGRVVSAAAAEAHPEKFLWQTERCAEALGPGVG
jgi:hypothetical protein